MKHIALSLLLLLASCTGCVRRLPERPPEATIDAQVAVTRVISSTSVEGTSVGTAWLVAEDAQLSYWVTAGHVCDPDAILTLGVGDLALALIAQRSDDPDLCVVVSLPVHLTPLRLAPADPRIGDELRYVGNPVNAMSNGMTPVFYGRAGGCTDGILYVAVPGYPGASGSAITDKHGEVVGVLVAVVRTWQQLTFAVDLSTLRAFLEEADVPLA